MNVRQSVDVTFCTRTVPHSPGWTILWDWLLREDKKGPAGADPTDRAQAEKTHHANDKVSKAADILTDGGRQGYRQT